MKYRVAMLTVFLGLPLFGCDSSDTGSIDGALSLRDKNSSDAMMDGTAMDLDNRLDGSSGDAACTVGATVCVDKMHQKVCKTVGGGNPTWVSETCTSGTLCLDASCSSSCVDQCTWGGTRLVSGKTETCKLFSVVKNNTVALSKGMHDKARQFNALLRKYHLPAGTVGDAIFSDTTYTKVIAYDGTGDSAIWTGSYLAAEALRFKVTGSPDASKNVESLVESSHRLFEVTGHKGYMARFTAPLNSGDDRLKALYKPERSDHHKVTFKGQDYFWDGDTSRDQYQGIILGYSLAYDVLSSSKHKQMIRDDIVNICNELIKQRTGVPVTIRLYAQGKWQKISFKANMQYVILNPSEYVNGAVYAQIGEDSSPSNLEASYLVGMREFFPDFALVFKQIPLLGLLITFPVYRADSAIMLANVLQVGMQVTKGVSGYTSTYSTYSKHYNDNINNWLNIMKKFGYIFSNYPYCWKNYHLLNISFEPIYNLIRLEPSSTLRTAFQDDVLAAKMWSIVKDHKNVFFSYILASHATQTSAMKAIISNSNTQFTQFPAPPLANVAVDNSNKYTADTKCTQNSTVPVNVNERAEWDFIWQRHPFLLKKAADLTRVYPGIDFLLPYWMGRKHAFLTDDGAGTCLRWTQ